MADVITRFKLETTQFDSKLRDTAKALQGIAHQASLGGKDFNNFSQKAIESARALGTVQSGANNTKDKLRDLVGSYNDAAKAYNSLTETAKQGEFGKAMSQSLQQLQQEIKRTKDDLYSMGDATKGGGGLFGGGKLDGMLQVFGGNVMTKIAGAGLSFASELKDMVTQGIELARQGEGIRIAFERLGRGDILQGLREATHGTVTDLELMKAAVKFNDFRLPLEELGTMLAFAQQKAKDTGQSVDYMVDSIVTGLGRKSLMILDNLGLSAAEIKEKMKDTGDMTKAVGEIIREQMSKAGDYVETAADRATKANVEVQNAMERLGETFQPLTDAGTSMFNSLKVGALDFINKALRPMINMLTEAGRMRKLYNAQKGTNDAKIQEMLEGLSKSELPQHQHRVNLAYWDKNINKYQQYLADYKTWQKDKTSVGAYDRMTAFQKETGLSMFSDVKEQLEVFKRQKADYVKLSKDLLTKKVEDNKLEEQSIDSLKKKLQELQAERKKAIEAGDTDLSKSLLKQINQIKTGIKGLGGSTSTTTTHTKTTAEKIAWDANKTYLAATHATDNMPSVWSMLGDKGLRKMMGIGAQQVDVGRILKEYVTDPDKSKRGKKKEDDELIKDVNSITSGISGIFSGIEQLGIELPEGLKDLLNGLQGITTILTGISSLITIITAIQGTKATPVIGWALAGGGIVPHAAGGYMIGGNSYSGDNIYAGGAWVNSGELVLNRAQQSTLASQLQGQDKQMHVVGEVQGEKIILVANRTFRRKGQGEIVTW